MFRTLLRRLSLGIAGLSTVVAVWLIVTDSSSGFLANLGLYLARWIFAVGSSISLVLNLLLLRLGAEPAWFKIVTALQVVPCVLLLAALADDYGGRLRASIDGAKVGRIVEAIEHDDVALYRRARSACDGSCRDGRGEVDDLNEAADVGAIGVARYLTSTELRHVVEYDFPLKVTTCAGRTVSVPDALSIAVVRGNHAMFDLLLPISDKRTRRSALWTAARFDRLDFVQRLLEAGVPISIRGQFIDQNETLLFAAAEGGAMNVGRWLIENRKMPVNAVFPRPDESPFDRTPLGALLESHDLRHDPDRVRRFAKLLVDHGAFVDASLRGTLRVLTNEIAGSDGERARLLVDLGASTASLDPYEQEKLQRLLAAPPGPRDAARGSSDCIGVETGR